MTSPPSAPRLLGGASSLAIVAGAMIGVGIFIFPPTVAALTPNTTTFLVLWGLGGLVALAGASAYAELGAAMPRAGGDYVFIREAFGDSLAFACGWVTFLGGFCGSLATLAVAVSQFQVPVLTGFQTSAVAFSWPWGAEVLWTQLIGVAIILAFTALNMLGLRLSAWMQAATTFLPFTLLVALAVFTLTTAFEAPTPADLAQATPPPGTPTSPGGVGDLVDAFLKVYFAYAGWNAIVYVAGEVKKPSRNIPLALIGGTVAVSMLYLLLCGAFVHAFGMERLGTTMEAGSALGDALGGRGLEVAMVALIAAGIVSSINATIMGGGRFAYAMAQDGVFWSGAGVLQSGTSLPQRALIAQCVVTVALVLTGTFDQIFQLTTIAMVVCGGLTVASLFVLRRRRPELERPYKALGYPLLPGLFLLASGFVVTVTLLQATGESAYAAGGIAVLVVAFFAHRLFGPARGR